MSVINTNVATLYTRSALETTGRELGVAMRQLSTGLRINSAKDDAAGLAIADRMTQQIRSLNQAVRNAGDAISLIQTAEGSTGEVSDMLQRMRELAVQAASDTNNAEQRGYLDLEFQQLKQEIVRITEATDWNGYSLLDGTAGERVGEMPVYKITSKGVHDSVFVSPTTTRTIAGENAGEVQTITFTGTPTTGSLKIGGVDITITSADTGSLSDVTAKIKTTLEASAAFDSSSGRTVEVAAGVVTITYGPTEGNVEDTEVITGAGLTKAVATTVEAVAAVQEAFDENGAFIKSGTLAIDVTSAGALSATFTDAAGEEITLTGVLSAAAGTVTFTASAGRNSEVMSDDLTYTFVDSDNTAIAVSSRAVGASVAVSGTAPAMQTGDLQINGVEIGASYAADDLLSPLNNASGSAIAKAAAINRHTSATGVAAKVNENIMTGQAMDASSTVVGQIFINGFATSTIISTLNNPRETRADVVRAINAITYQTGVTATDTGSDSKGVTLNAADGRNIEVRFETTSSSRVFGARLGLRDGVQAGTYSLESRVEDPIVLTTSSTGSIARSGLTTGDFSTNEAVVKTLDRSPVLPSLAQEEAVTISGDLAAGDVYSLTINGTSYSHTVEAGQGAQDVRDGLITAAGAASGITVSAGGNTGELRVVADDPGTAFTLTVSESLETGSTGAIELATVQENFTAPANTLNAGDLVINGIEIGASRLADDQLSSRTPTSGYAGASAIAIAAAINAKADLTGVRAEAQSAVVAGSYTDTTLPSTNGTQSLFINGVQIDVNLVKDELGATRRAKIVDAINVRSGQHGVTASDNGRGLTLSTDGRNLSVWFDANTDELAASQFGLSNNDEVAQVSTVTMGGTVTTSDTATAVINGVTVTSAAAAAATPASLAEALETAINAKITSGDLTNISVSRSAEVITITSLVAGTAFTVAGASTTDADATMSIQTLTANSSGTGLVDALRGGATTSDAVKTVYGGVSLISDAALLPPLPQPIGAPPPDVPVGVPIEIQAGGRGYGVDSNFRNLGFFEGTFGGQSSVEMSPPRVARLSFQVGTSADQVITVDLSDFGKDGPITSEITADVDEDLEDRTLRINTREGAQGIVANLDSVLDKVNQQRAVMGAVMSRLEHVIDNLMNVSMNTQDSRSQIRDADYAAASSELARAQIMQQASMAVLAQANTSQGNVLRLLQ